MIRHHVIPARLTVVVLVSVIFAATVSGHNPVVHNSDPFHILLGHPSGQPLGQPLPLEPLRAVSRGRLTFKGDFEPCRRLLRLLGK